MRNHARRLAVASALAILAGTPAALAQKGPSKPKGTKPAATEAPVSAPAPVDSPPAPPAAAAPPADPVAAAPGAAAVEPEKKIADHDPTEDPTKKYLFIGLRYRGTIIPKAFMNIFVKEGATVYSNSIGAELDIRKDGFSLIPAVSYTEYGTSDILFRSTGVGTTDAFVGNYSVINSGMKAIFLSADLLWSAQITKGLEFEYGAGFGIGFLFGDLVTNWVSEDPNGSITGSDGRRFTQCQAEGAKGSGCNRADHQNATTAKVGGYTEPSWANGGSKPNIFPYLSVPQIGLRIKPAKEFEGRFGVGFSLTGVWLGISGNYGIPTAEKPEKKAAGQP